MSAPGAFRRDLQPVSPAPASKTTAPAPPVVRTPLELSIEAAGHERQAANANLWQLQRHIDQPPKRRVARTRFVQGLASDYLPAIQALREAGTPDELRAAQSSVEARLERGWGVQGERADELWAQLLAQHEGLTDALTGNALAGLLDRLDTWGKGSQHAG